MSNTETAANAGVDDFARRPVPQENTAHGFHLALIIIGGTIGFAVFVVASQIGGSLGYRGAALAFTTGSLVLGVMGAVTSYVGAKSRLSTYLLTEFAFGRSGAKIANLAVAISLIGWYGVISNTLGYATQQIIQQSFDITVSPYLTVSVASFLMIAVTAAGFKGIDKLALTMVPIMVLFMGYAAYRALAQSSGEGFVLQQAFTFKTAVSAVIGTYIAGVIIQPDYSRFAVNTRHAIWSAFIALGVMFPVVQYFSAIPSMASGEADIIIVMATLGIAIPAFCLFFLGAWASNVLCLYSSGLSIATVFEKARLRHIIYIIGVIGTALAFVPAQPYIISFLVLLGVTIPPIGAIYIIDAAVFRRFQMPLDAPAREPRVNIAALAAWALAAVFGYLSQVGVLGLTSIASIDSLIVSALAYGAFSAKRWLGKPAQDAA